MSQATAQLAKVCYGCGFPMRDASQAVIDRLPKKHRGHLVYVCADMDCADEWANSDKPGVVQCSCGTFWGQLP